MKRIFLLRHLKSSWDFPELDDYDRPLNERGDRAGPLICRHIDTHAIRPDVVLCSSARRTRQTMDYIVEALDGVPVCYERRLYEATAAQLLKRLRELPHEVESVLLLGHNPGLHKLASGLTEREVAESVPGLADLREKYPTGSLATLTAPLEDWADLASGLCRLRAFVRPKDLEN
ncbi:SixA phosphatase family protein [Caenispirillum bisanense]|uniref:Phosphohistidine phosphatase n=1 Tax=Caenispirillum bisanense TaxID=414052 RepID=A0A286GNF9_9PROT|nr:histidine phosphatase family protein [Caenispirillum bisanense]SOD97060.1 phosphohistidine phosphatase [Caenispirillum bisanense]